MQMSEDLMTRRVLSLNGDSEKIKTVLNWEGSLRSARGRLEGEGSGEDREWVGERVAETSSAEREDTLMKRKWNLQRDDVTRRLQTNEVSILMYHYIVIILLLVLI